jgi:type III pantothenate kinase
MKADLAAQTGIDESAIKTIATGGLNSILQPITDAFDDIDKELTLHGLRRAASYAAV